MRFISGLSAGEEDDEEAAADGDGVCEEGGREVFAEGFGEGSANGGSAKGSGYGADGSGDQAEAHRLTGEAEGCSGEGSADDAGDELRGDLAAGGGGAFV